MGRFGYADAVPLHLQEDGRTLQESTSELATILVENTIRPKKTSCSPSVSRWVYLARDYPATIRVTQWKLRFGDRKLGCTCVDTAVWYPLLATFFFFTSEDHVLGAVEVLYCDI